MPTLAHKIRLDPTPDQIQYFKQAGGAPGLSGIGRSRSGIANMLPGRSPKPRF